MGSDSEAENVQLEEKKKVKALAPIAKPLAGKKLCKRTLKLVHTAAENKCVKRGVKEVVKSIRRGHRGICVIAGNISPIDVMSRKVGHSIPLCSLKRGKLILHSNY